MQAELSQTPTIRGKTRLCGSYLNLIGQELLGTLLLAPYGYRTWKLHRLLPNPRVQSSSLPPKSSVFLIKDVRYGSSECNTFDIYLPSAASRAEAEGRATDCPVAIFCHGGVWATGAKWQFAPMAACLARRGIVTCVLQYSLYPEALGPQMVEEVSAAITHVIEGRGQGFGGSARNITVIGHSAGAQLALMAMLKLIQQNQNFGEHQRLPQKVIGLAGAYDLGLHYEYEVGRGVAYLSTMTRAFGGRPGLPSQSPAVILNSIAAAAGVPRQGQSEVSAQQMRSWGAGVPIASTIGSSLYAGSVDGASMSTGMQEARSEAGPEQDLHLTMNDIRKLPEIVLMSSRRDITVPWVQSSIMHSAVQRCHGRSRHIVYDDLSHGDFVIDWQFKEVEEKGLPEFANELVRLILDESESDTERI